MNLVVSIVSPEGHEILQDICAKLKLPLVLTLYARGTATKTMLDLLGIASREKRVVLASADEAKTEELFRAQRQRLYIDAPGNGISAAIPIKSVGGGKTLAFLSDGRAKKQAPKFDFGHELVLVIANEGSTDLVMEAARAAGASGGTVLHAKGANAENAEKFFKVSIASEKELILIVAKASEKAAIMAAVMKLAPETGAMTFSLPVSGTAGFGI